MPSILWLRRPVSADNHRAENSDPSRRCYCRSSPSRSNPSDYRNRHSPANGIPWAGWRAAATAYRAPIKRRPPSPRRVCVQPPGARAAVIASAEVRGLRTQQSWRQFGARLAIAGRRQAHGEHRAFARLARHGHVPAHHARELAVMARPRPVPPKR